MRILVNAANLQKGGALQVAASLLEEFAHYPEHQFHIIGAPPLIDAAPIQLSAIPFELTSVRQSPTRGLRSWRLFVDAARSVEKSWKPDVALTVFGPGLWRPRVPHLMGFANGLYLFSDSRFIQQDWPVGKIARSKYGLRRRVLLQRVRAEADSWWVETNAARTALSRAAIIREERIAVIPNALGPAFIPFLERPLQGVVDDDERQVFRVLVMGACYPNKNLSLITEMLPLLRDIRIEFLFTLPEEDFRTVFVPPDTIDSLVNLGPLAPHDAPVAYAGADAVLLPSKLETFSAVLLEAAAMQKPLLAPDLPFAREVCGDSAQYFDPWDAASAAAALRAVMANAELRQRLISTGYKRVQAAPTAAYRARRILDQLTVLAKRA